MICSIPNVLATYIEIFADMLCAIFQYDLFEF